MNDLDPRRLPQPDMIQTLAWGFRFAGRKDVTPMSTPKKIGFLALLVMLILFIVNRVRNEVTVEVDTDE